jgi:hypothetical protein
MILYLSSSTIDTTAYTLLPVDLSEGTVTFTRTNAGLVTQRWRTEQNVPNNASWGTKGATVSIVVSTGNTNYTIRVRINRISSAGTVLQSSAWTGTQTASAGTKTFTVSSTAWTAGSATDRLEIEVEANNATGMSTQTFIVDASTPDSYINTGIGIVVPAATSVSTSASSTAIASVIISAAVSISASTSAASIAQKVINGKASVEATATTEANGQRILNFYGQANISAEATISGNADKLVNGQATASTETIASGSGSKYILGATSLLPEGTLIGDLQYALVDAQVSATIETTASISNSTIDWRFKNLTPLTDVYGTGYYYDTSGTAISNDGQIILACAAYSNNPVFSNGVSRFVISTNGGANWSETLQIPGDGNWKGYISCVKILPNGHIFIGVSNGRFYKSINNGTSWIELQPAGNVNGDYKNFAVSDDGQIIVVAVNNVIYKSTNGGSTWTTLPKINASSTYIQIYGGNSTSQIIYASDSIVVNGSANGYYKSIDYGDTWEYQGFNGDTFYSISSLNSDGRIGYFGRNFARTFNYGESYETSSIDDTSKISRTGDIVIQQTHNLRYGVKYSKNGGIRIKSFIPYNSTQNQYTSEHYSHNISPNGRYISIPSGYGYNSGSGEILIGELVEEAGIFSSGVALRPKTTATASLAKVISGQASVTIESNVTGVGSIDDWTHETINPFGIPTTTVGYRFQVVFVSKNGQTVVLCKDQQFNPSTNQGFGWENDYYISYNGGTSWQLLYTTPEVLNSSNTFNCFVSEDNQTILLVYIHYTNPYTQKIIRSTNGGNSWEEVNHGFSLGQYFGFNILYSRNAEVIYARVYTNPENKIYKSTDLGSTWTELTNLNPCYATFSCSEDGRFVYASKGTGWSDQQLYLSDDYGITWRLIQPSYGYGTFDLSCTSANGKIIYLTYTVQGPGLYESRLIKSEDFGETWVEIYPYGEGAIGDSYYTNFIYTDATGNVVVTLASNANEAKLVKYSLDGGTTWKNTYNYADWGYTYGNGLTRDGKIYYNVTDTSYLTPKVGYILEKGTYSIPDDGVIGHASIFGEATISATGEIISIGYIEGAVNVSCESNLSASGELNKKGEATISSETTAIAFGSQTISSSVTIDSEATAGATANITLNGSASISVQTTASAEALTEGQITGAVDISSETTAASLGEITRSASSTIIIEATATSDSIVTIQGSSSIVTGSTAQGSTQKLVNASTSIQSETNTSASSYIVIEGNALISSQASIAASGVITKDGSTSLQSSVDSSATAVKIISTQGNLEANANVTSQGYLTLNGSSNITAEVTIEGDLLQVGQINGDASVTAEATLQASGVKEIQGSSSITVDTSCDSNAIVILSSSASIQTSTSLTSSGVIERNASSSLTTEASISATAQLLLSSYTELQAIVTAEATGIKVVSHTGYIITKGIELKDVYIGNVKVKKIYIGLNKIFDNEYFE